MRHTPYRHISPASLADTLLHLALIAPGGAVKSKLAIAAAHLTGCESPDACAAGLLNQIRDIREELATRFLRGSGDVPAVAISHLDEALRLVSRAALPSDEVLPPPVEPPPQVRPVSEG